MAARMRALNKVEYRLPLRAGVPLLLVLLGVALSTPEFATERSTAEASAGLPQPRKASGAPADHSAAKSAKADAPQQTSTPPPNCGQNWRVVSSPNVAGAPNSLRGIAAVSGNDIWAVGYTGLIYSA